MGGTVTKSASGLSDAQPASLGTGSRVGEKLTRSEEKKLMSFIDQWLDE